MKSEEKLMLIYNTLSGEELSLKMKDFPADWVITADRQCFLKANVVVFYLSNLYRELEYDLEQPNGQLWVGWYMEAENEYPWFRLPEIRENFDLMMSYRQDADVVYPFYRHEYVELLSQKVSTDHKQNKCCMSASGRMHSGGRLQYLKELQKHTGINLYGMFSNSKHLQSNREIDDRPNIFREYKFVISFEDAIDTDYVTEKFFDPLIAGSVPVYFGAPNIDDFAPGDNSFVNIRNYKNPKALAQFINSCYEDEQLYAQFFEWKNRPLRQSFLQKAEVQKEHPFVRLCRIVDEKRMSQKHADDADETIF